MILERAAAYVLALVCIFQAVLPSWTIRPQCWRSIDLRIGSLRIQGRKHLDSDFFARRPAAGAGRSERPISLLSGRQRNLKRLRICNGDSGCMTAWLDDTSHGWSISKGMEDNFEKKWILSTATKRRLGVTD